jgi:hypothetical protein
MDRLEALLEPFAKRFLPSLGKLLRFSRQLVSNRQTLHKFLLLEQSPQARRQTKPLKMLIWSFASPFSPLNAYILYTRVAYNFFGYYSV